MNMINYKDQYNIITNNAVEIIPDDEFVSRLKTSYENKLPLNIKLGCDPSRPDLHIGHSVVLNKLKDFQDLGHNVILVIGDFTAMIGDPTGRNKTRPQISIEETYENSKTYINQVSKILNIEKTRVVYNSKWLNNLNFSKVVELSSKFTVAQFLERDDFSKRYKAGKPISLHEFMYPLAQAYDSVYLRSDVEIGGTDQKFNLLLARSLQKEYDLTPQIAITMPLLEGTDGVDKMSKSYNNYIAFNDTPDDMYGKILSIPDSLILKYFSLVVNVSSKEVEDYKLMLKMNKINNRDLKRKLAREVIKIYYNENMSSQAELNFDKIFIKKDVPENIPTFKLTDDIKLVDLIYESKTVASKSEIKRLIKQGAVKIDDNPILDINYIVSNNSNVVIKVGKRRFVKALI